MKIQLMWVGVVTAIVMMTTSADTAFAGTEGHGGTPVLIRDLDNIQQISDETGRIVRDEIRMFLISYFQYRTAFPVTQFPNPQIEALYRGLLTPKFLRLLSTATYNIQTERPCRDLQGNPLPASTYPGDPSKPICVNPKMLAELSANFSEIFALMAHEHAHQLGTAYADRNHALAHFIMTDSKEFLANMVQIWRNWLIVKTFPRPEPRDIGYGAGFFVFDISKPLLLEVVEEGDYGHCDIPAVKAGIGWPNLYDRLLDFSTVDYTTKTHYRLEITNPLQWIVQSHLLGENKSLTGLQGRDFDGGRIPYFSLEKHCVTRDLNLSISQEGKILYQGIRTTIGDKNRYVQGVPDFFQQALGQ